MMTNIENLVSITEANQNFSKVAKQVDNQGPVIILKNNKPKYALIPIHMLVNESLANSYNASTQHEENNILSASKKLLEKNKLAYEVLAREEN